MSSKPKNGKKKKSGIKPAITKKKGIKKKKKPKAVAIKVKEIAPVAASFQRETLPARITAKNDATSITRSEYVTDVLGSTGERFLSYDINPCNQALFAWLSLVAQGYTEYVIKKISLRLVPAISTAANGIWAATILYDVFEALFTSKQQMLNYGGTIASNVWSPLEFIGNIDAMSTFRKYYNYIAGTVPSGADQRAYNNGTAVVCTSGQASSAAVGELYVDYEVQLSNANVDISASPYDLGYWSYTGNQVQPSYLVPHLNNIGVTLDPASTSTSITLHHTRYGSGQEYMFMRCYSMSAYTSGSLTFSSLVAATQVAMDTWNVDWLKCSNDATNRAVVMAFFYVPTSATVTIGITDTATGTVAYQWQNVSPVAPNVLAYHPVQFGRQWEIREIAGVRKLVMNMPHLRRVNDDKTLAVDMKNSLGRNYTEKVPYNKDVMLMDPVAGLSKIQIAPISSVEVFDQNIYSIHDSKLLRVGDPRLRRLMHVVPGIDDFDESDWDSLLRLQDRDGALLEGEHLILANDAKFSHGMLDTPQMIRVTPDDYETVPTPPLAAPLSVSRVPSRMYIAERLAGK